MKPPAPLLRTRGFTLIELMVVITIIVILAGLMLGAASYVKTKQANEKAKIQIALLSKAIEEYKGDMGKYPGEADDSPTDGDISEELYEALFHEGYENSEDPDNWEEGEARKIYVPELNPETTKLGWVTTATSIPDSTKIVDPWGKPYRYRKGNSALNPDFDLWSEGKDGETNEDDPKDKNSRDDIRN
ncbi:MAG: type II secretion system protein GspG [Verrucomicrobiota bacterium]